MTPKKRRRLAFAVAVIAAGAGSAGLIVYALKDNVLYFYSPTDVETKHVAPGVAFRIGGLVEKKSLKHGKGADVSFAVTDGRTDIKVEYAGVLPAQRKSSVLDHGAPFSGGWARCRGRQVSVLSRCYCVPR